MVGKDDDDEEEAEENCRRQILGELAPIRALCRLSVQVLEASIILPPTTTSITAAARRSGNMLVNQAGFLFQQLQKHSGVRLHGETT